MTLSKYARSFRLITLLSCSLLLVVVLAACSLGGSTSTSTSTPTATAKPSPTPSPTPAVSLTTYTGNGYTIGYPQGWKATTTSTGVSFADSTSAFNFVIVVASDPNGIATASTFLNAEVSASKTKLKNPQTVSVPPTTTIGGDSWVQSSLAGTGTSGGQSVVVQFVIACDNHPANSASTKSFSLVYGTAQALFSTANTMYFQPMLQSFKFTS